MKLVNYLIKIRIMRVWVRKNIQTALKIGESEAT